MSADSPAAVVVDGTDSYEAKVTEAGSLKVDAAPVAPPGTTRVSDIDSGDISGTVDKDYTITNTKILMVQQFSGGGEVTVTGNRIELWYIPDANPANDELLAVGYASGVSFEITVNRDFTGDGTKKIRIRRVNMTGGSVHITGAWVGYEK